MENPTSPGSRWKKGRLLGRGSFGDVYLGLNSESGEMCTMKEVTLFSDDAKSKESAQQLGQEIMILSRLRHPNIVQYYGSETVEDKLYIYLEYVSGGSIYKLLQEYGQFDEIAIRSCTQQILSGLAYLHAKNTVHRDIKGANILVDPTGRVKLADFGMAKHVPAMFKIGNSKELPEIPDHLSNDGKDFVQQCLQRNPLHRPTAAQLLDHPFVKNVAFMERPFVSIEPSEELPPFMNSGRSMGTGPARHVSGFDSDGIAIHQPRGSKFGSGFRITGMSSSVLSED